MERELLNRINNVENMNENEFLFKVLTDLELEFPNHKISVIESIKRLFMVKFGTYSVLLTLDDIKSLKDVNDPYALDRYLLAHFLKDGMDVDPKASNYLRHIFGIYDDSDEGINFDDEY